MIRRLIYERGQQGLANENMKSWRAYLRKQAEERQVHVIDTEGMPIDESVNELQSVIANRLNLRKFVLEEIQKYIPVYHPLDYYMLTLLLASAKT